MALPIQNQYYDSCVALFTSLHRKDDKAEDKSLEICPIVCPILHFFNATTFLSQLFSGSLTHQNIYLRCPNIFKYVMPSNATNNLGVHNRFTSRLSGHDLICQSSLYIF